MLILSQSLDLAADDSDGPFVKFFDSIVNTEYSKKHWISPAIYENLTPLVKNIGPLVSPLITGALRKVDDEILKVVANGPDEEPEVPTSINLVNWKDAGRVEGFMKKVRAAL